MPVSCVVGGCTRNKAKTPEVFWLTFPKDVVTQRAWIQFVNNTRSDFQFYSASRPIVCSAHFSDDCVDETVSMKRSLGLPFRFKLKVGSVPSIKAPTVSVVTTSKRRVPSSSRSTTTAQLQLVPSSRSATTAQLQLVPSSRSATTAQLQLVPSSRSATTAQLQLVPSSRSATTAQLQLVPSSRSTTTAQLQPDGVGCSSSQAVGISGGAYLKRKRARVWDVVRQQVEDEYREQFGDVAELEIMDDGDQDPLRHDSHLPPTSRKKRFPLQHKDFNKKTLDKALGLSEAVNTRGFNKETLDKVLGLSEAGEDTRANYPGRMANPRHLTAKVTRPDRAEAGTSFVSHFGKPIEPVVRPEGTESVVVPTRIQRQRKSSVPQKSHQEGESSSSS